MDEQWRIQAADTSSLNHLGGEGKEEAVGGIMAP